MQAGDADVVEALHAVAEELGRQRRLLGDGDVGRAGADDGDVAAIGGVREGATEYDARRRW